MSSPLVPKQQEEHAGTDLHRLWLEKQLARNTFAAPPPPTAQVATQAQAAASRRWTRGDSSAGTEEHDLWLQRQLSGAHASSSLTALGSPIRGQMASPPRQLNDLLPAGVSAMLRGQDLSAASHEEWLTRQLGCGRGAGSSSIGEVAAIPHSTPVSARSNSTDRAQDRELRLVNASRDPSIGSRVAQLSSGVRGDRAAQTGGQEDYAAGSTLHARWLERQLLAQKHRT